MPTLFQITTPKPEVMERITRRANLYKSVRIVRRRDYSDGYCAIILSVHGQDVTNPFLLVSGFIDEKDVREGAILRREGECDLEAHFSDEGVMNDHHL